MKKIHGFCWNMSYIKRFAILLFLSLLGLELFFALRIASFNFVPMRSTAFERTAVVELLREGQLGSWRHEWRDYDDISENLKRAVIAAEDSGFINHNGVEWNAIWSAWQHNQNIEANNALRRSPRRGVIRGGSTITQQLAKNLFLSTEQTYVRKAQELVITFMLEVLLSKEDMLELYLNHAEWAKGVYGAQAAVQLHFPGHGVSASTLSPQQAATLAAMLPRPRSYATYRYTAGFKQRVGRIMGGMPLVRVP